MPAAIQDCCNRFKTLRDDDGKRSSSKRLSSRMAFTQWSAVIAIPDITWSDKDCNSGLSGSKASDSSRSSYSNVRSMYVSDISRIVFVVEWEKYETNL